MWLLLSYVYAGESDSYEMNTWTNIWQNSKSFLGMSFGRKKTENSDAVPLRYDFDSVVSLTLVI